MKIINGVKFWLPKTPELYSTNFIKHVDEGTYTLSKTDTSDKSIIRPAPDVSSENIRILLEAVESLANSVEELSNIVEHLGKRMNTDLSDIKKRMEQLEGQVEHKLGVLKQPVPKENRFESLVEEIEYDHIPDIAK